jgi:uncharacterized membrane protein YkoI
MTALPALLVSYFGARFGALLVFIGIVELPNAPVTNIGQKKMIVRSCGIHRAVPMTALMMRLAALALVLVASAYPARAAEEARACLSKSEQRAAISNGQAVTLAQAIRSARGSVRGRGSREVVNAKLCREDKKGLVYLLTVLSRDGKVTHMTVDATSGKVVDAL